MKKSVMSLFGEDFQIRKEKSALQDFTRQFVIDGQDGFSPKDFLVATKPKITEKLKENKQTKTKMILSCEMERAVMSTGEVIQDSAAFHSQIEINLEGNDENEIFNEMASRILENLANFQQRGSNWRFVRIENLEIHFIDYSPIRGSTWLPLPKDLRDKKAILNMKNKDQECFKYAMTRALNPVEKDGERISRALILQSENFCWKGISFPMQLSEIGKFEKQNPGISINIFGWEKEVFPLRISKTKGRSVDLIMIGNGKRIIME